MLEALIGLAIFVCIISAVLWFFFLIINQQGLRKLFRNIGLISLLFVVICSFTISSENLNKEEKGYTYNNFTVYPVTVTSAKVNSDGDLVIKGTSEAPKGAKVLAESNVESSNDKNEASPTNLEKDGYEKIKNGKFNITLSTIDLYGSDELKVGQKLKPTIFAVTGYHEKYDDDIITSDLRKAVKKANIKPFVYTATAKMCKKVNDDDSDNDSDRDSNNSSDDDDKDSDKKSKGLSKSEKIEAALGILKDSYKDKAEVKYDSSADMFTILPTINGYKDLLEEAEAGDTSDWHTVTDSIDKVSRSLYENVKLKIPVSLVNPDDTSKVLYTSIDGLASYDFTEDK